MSRLELLRAWSAARKELNQVAKIEADLRDEVFAEFFDIEDLERSVDTGCGVLRWKPQTPALEFKPSDDFETVPDLEALADEPKSALDALRRAAWEKPVGF